MFGHDEFDRVFKIVAEEQDVHFARDLFTDSTMTWLVDDPLARAMPFRFDGRSLVMPGAGPLLDPRQGMDMILFLHEIYARVPSRRWAAATLPASGAFFYHP
ncbi:MAG: hypothetical protein ACRD0P_18575 [Stackebrandtia sp.]